MNSINSNHNSIKDGFSAATSCIARNIVQFGYYTVRNFSKIPETMQRNLSVTIAVIGLSNLIFLGVIKKLAEPHFENRQNSTITRRTFKYISLNTLLGVCAYQFNLWLSKTTRYTLSPQILLTVSVNFVFAHMIWNLISRSSSTVAPTTTENSSVSNKHVVSHNLNNQKESNLQVDENKKNKSSSIGNKWQELFAKLLKFKKDEKGKSPDEEALEAPPEAPEAPPEAPEAPPEAPEAPPEAPGAPPGGPSLVPDLTLLDNILLENEPPEPVLADMKANGDNPSQILAKIQEYIEGLKKARLPLQNMLDEKAELIKKKKELETEISTRQKTIAQLEKMVKILSIKDDVIFINVRIDNNLHPMPLYSDKQWETLNKTFMAEKLAPLTIFYKKSNHLACTQTKITKLKNELKEVEEAKEDYINSLELIENKKHGSISFNNFGNILINKNKKLTKWLATESQYKKMTTPKPEDKSSLNPIAKDKGETKIKPKEFADNHPDLKLKEWAKLQDYQNFQIIVNNKNAKLSTLQDLFVLK